MCFYTNIYILYTYLIYYDMPVELQRLHRLYDPGQDYKKRPGYAEPGFASVPKDIEMRQTLTREEAIFRMSVRMVDGRTYLPYELEKLVDTYTPSMFQKSDRSKILEDGIEGAKLEDVESLIGYILPRFLSPEHISDVNNADIKFTDDPIKFYENKDPKYIPKSRSRVYSRSVNSQTNKPEITFLLRHNIKENYTDLMELVSFMGFIEAARVYAQNSNSEHISRRLKELKSGEGMTLGASKMGMDYLWKIGSENSDIPPAMQDVMNKICIELNAQSIKPPRNVIFGNDYSVPLLIGTGVLNKSDFEEIRQEAEREGKILLLDEEIVRQFSVLQYLNRYNGKNELILNLKQRYNTAIGSIKQSLIEPAHTALGSPIDIIDFSRLDDTIIERIENEDIQQTVSNLKKIGFRYFSLPYPLGDSINGLVRAFNNTFDMNSKGYGFFGKVGAVTSKDDTNIKQGWVVMPNYTAPLDIECTEDMIPFNNALSPQDVIIIPSAKTHLEASIAVDAVTLEAASDFLPARRILKTHRNTDQVPALLVDMEAHHFNKICRELGILPSALYYLSDTQVDKPFDPYDDSSNQANTTISIPLGARGVLASLVSSISIVKKIAEMQ